MLQRAILKVFGTKAKRDERKLRPLVEEIKSFEPALESLSDEQLQAKTDEFKNRLAKGETVDDLVCEAFAVVKEACRRLLGKTWDVCGIEVTWDMVPFDVQLMGAIVLHRGTIAEMATGEGKTLAATMPLYLNALEGKGCHLVTVNDYLAKRDREWMGPIYEFLGLAVGCIQHDMTPEQRRAEYAKHITYGTNSEFGFDYLRDNMASDKDHMVQREHHYAIVDEVDSILIDEARTPLIISGPVEHMPQKFDEFKPMVEQLVRRQNRLAAELTGKVREAIESDDEDVAGKNLLLLRMGAPKSKGFLQLLEDIRNQKLMLRAEKGYMLEKLIPELQEELFYAIEERSNNVVLTEKGRGSLSASDRDLLIVPDLDERLGEIETHTEMTEEEKRAAKLSVEEEFHEKNENIHTVSQLLKAYALFEKDVEYVVSDNKVIIVDEFTGRLMPGRRYSDGLHQAIEAKENVKVGEANQTLATITLQYYFRMYDKLSGMTGTADTEAGEFRKIYELDVVVIPTNEPVIRDDCPDVIYKTEREKARAIIDEIVELHNEGRPVLVGTVSVDKSERLSAMLKKRGIRHQVLNARYHQQEAGIISKAGEGGTVTIATNMAGRGTDIKLGEGIPALGGLHVLGTERHESRRIDNQLRGRCGRQGDPGSSRFYLSLEDNLMRIFGGDRLGSMLDSFGMQEDEPIEHKYVTRAIETAQHRVERNNFAIREQLVKYDDIMNLQREIVYSRRREILNEDDIRPQILEVIEDLISENVGLYVPKRARPDEIDLDGLKRWVERTFVFTPHFEELGDDISPEAVHEMLFKRARQVYEQKETLFGADLMKHVARMVVHQAVDSKWKDHLLAMDHLKEAVGMRAYAQRDPVGRTRLSGPGTGTPAEMPMQRQRAAAENVPQAIEPRRVSKKPGRNEPCPCGSGKKYKMCCGR